MTKYLNAFYSFFIIIVIAAVLYSSRHIFFYRYEPEYYESWYYHSQWNYPSSTRGISDGELYKFVGYRLETGENPFNINFEMPPFGKYLYGLAERYLQNPYWVNIFLYFSSIVLLFFLSKEILKDRRAEILTLLLFVTSPFVATQLRETMLDLPLMFLYLAQAYFFIKFLGNKKIIYLVASGLFLGLATGTKPGIYTPLVGLLGLIFIFFTSKKKLTSSALFSGATAFGYLLAYICYFLKHPNPIPWLRLHEKSLKFYVGPPGKINYLNQWKSIFLNIYQGWWQSKSLSVGDWSFMLPLGVITMVFILILAIKKQNRQWLYLSSLALVFLTVNTFIPFWPRYLMPVIPLFALLISLSFKKFGYLVLLLSFLNLPFLANSLSSNRPLGDAQAVARFISTRAYSELYRSITLPERKKIPEKSFISLCEKFWGQLGTRAIEVEVGEIVKSGNLASVKFKNKYFTKYGELIIEPTFNFIKTNNQWRLSWKWDYLAPGYGPESKIVINEKPASVTSLMNPDILTVAKSKTGKEVYIMPRVMFDWGKFSTALSQATGQGTGKVDEIIRRVVPDHFPRFVGYLDEKLGEEGISKAASIPGVTFQEAYYPLSLDKSNISESDFLKLVKAARDKNIEFVEIKGHIENSQGEKIPLQFQSSQADDSSFFTLISR